MKCAKVNPVFFNNPLFLIGIFVLTILFGSCQNDEEQVSPNETQPSSLNFDKSAIEKAEIKEKLAYKNFHLTKLMEETLKVFPDFDEQSSKKLDKLKGPDTFYFDALLNNSTAGRGQRILNDSIRFSLDAFVELEGESWYPYVQKIKEGREEHPLFLINSYDPDTNREIVQGYNLDASGNLELMYRDLSEDDVLGPNPVEGANENAIYVLGISPENLEDDTTQIFAEADGGGGGSISPYVKMQYVTIKDKKESWLEKADVKFEVVAVTANSLNPGQYSTHCGVNAGLGCYWNGSFLVHCNNSEVGDKRLINRQMDILQSGTFAEIAAFVIFEYDSWPAPSHVYEKILNGESLKVGYRSYQSPYDELIANFHEQNPYILINGKNLSRNNSDIEYNLK